MNTIDAIFTFLIHILLKNMWVYKCEACFIHRTQNLSHPSNSSESGEL